MIKNYTSSVPVYQTVARIEHILSKNGASNIMKNYDDGRLIAITFAVFVPEMGRNFAIRLPVNVAAITKVFKEAVKRPRKGTLNKMMEQAERTAWKIIQDWVEIQISLIKMEQAEFMQVFLPYIFDGKTDYYTSLKEDGLKLLGGKK